VRAPTSGYTCFRAVFEPSNLRDMPELEWLTTGISGTRTVYRKGAPLLWFMVYLCRNGSLVNFVGFYTDSSEEQAGMYSPLTSSQTHQRTELDWKSTGSREEILAKFHDFDPKFLSVVDLPSHSPIHKWHCRVLPALPTWIKGRSALLGDAAHATLPLLGQGASIAIEEAGALGCLFPPGTKREDVPARLRAYQDLRKRRGDFVHTESVRQAQRNEQGKVFVNCT
jgi:salicylate hydroxylase